MSPTVKALAENCVDDLVAVVMTTTKIGPIDGDSPFAPTSHSLVASTHPPPLRNEP